MKESTKGIIALISLSAIFGFIGIIGRYFGEDFTALQQVYLRTFLGSLFIAAFFYRSINYSRYVKIGNREKVLLIGRGLLNYLGIVLFVYGILNTSLLNVSAVTLFPATTIFSMIFFGEKLGFKKAIILGVSFGGLLLIGAGNMNFAFGKGEFYALIGDILIGLAYVSRKFHSEILSNREIALGMIVTGTFSIALISFMIGEGIPNVGILFGLEYGMMYLLAGILNAGIIVLVNYGFSKVTGILSERIGTLEIIFAFLFGFVFYLEVPNKLEFLGIFIIIMSILWLQKIEYSEVK